MRVTLLGTSSAEGWPGLFCRCDACDRARQLGGKNIRTRSSALIDEQLKLDFPPDILHQVIQGNLDLTRLTAILFTHAHDDHFSAPELQYRGDYFVPTPFVQRLPVYGPEEVIARLRIMSEASCLSISLQPLEPWQTVEIADRYRVTPLLAQHDPDLTCFNYIIEDTAGSVLLYATDTGWYDEETWSFLEPIRLDGIVVECGKGWNESGYAGHLSIPEVIRMKSRLAATGSLGPNAVIMATHFSHLCGLMHDELTAALAPHGICAGYDGMTVTLAR